MRILTCIALVIAVFLISFINYALGVRDGIEASGRVIDEILKEKEDEDIH